MAADLHIHVFEPKEEEQVRLYLKSTFWSTDKGHGYDEVFVGGKWVHLNDWDDEKYPEPMDMRQKYLPDLDEKVAHGTPSVWVGEVSWLKAALFEDGDTYIPEPVARVCQIIGSNLPVIDDALIQQVAEALRLPNNTIKAKGVWDGKGYSLASAESVIEFLTKHKGKKAFTISW
jgi:hypothetical protein